MVTMETPRLSGSMLTWEEVNRSLEKLNSIEGLSGISSRFLDYINNTVVATYGSAGALLATNAMVVGAGILADMIPTNKQKDQMIHELQERLTTYESGYRERGTEITELSMKLEILRNKTTHRQTQIDTATQRVFRNFDTILELCEENIVLLRDM